ncbi:histone H1-like [Amblyraja radiata]|uniref:histone H1-like n=1 Tax=Amblyraja radiata TaxID=386614 RepID=UPI001402B5A0|nr:histone H1-like [Amblyraja radiata]
MSPPRPLAAFKLRCAAASRFISHSVLSVRESLCRVTDMTETAAAEAAPQAVPAAQTKAPKKKKAPARKKAAGPKLSDQIDNIVADCHDRRGMSFYAIKKGLAAKGVDVEKCRHLIKTGIKRKLVNGSLVQIKGVGASGSFKTGQGEGAVKSAKKAVPAAKTSKNKKSTSRKTPIKKLRAKKSTIKRSLMKKSPSKKVVAKKPALKQMAAKKSLPKKAAPKKQKKAVVKKAKAAKKPVKGQAKTKSAKPKKAVSKK